MDDSGAPNGDKASCLRQVLLLFRDIDQQHLDEVAEQHQFCPTATIAAILDQQEQGHQYPRRKGTLKRKRAVADVDEDGDEDDEDDEDDDGGGEIGGSSRSVKVKVDGPRTPSKAYSEMATKLLCQDFRNAPKPTVKKAMLPAHGNSLFKTYMTMDQETRNWNQDNPRWIPKKSLTKVEAAFLRSKIENIDRSAFDEAECLALDDFLAARRVRDEKDAEELNLEQAKENGAVQDCGCCFEEFPLNRMVHCEGNVVHWFCRKCMRQQAETVIGQGQHTITCLSMDACSAGYSHTQRKTFIDKKLQVALDRNEAQAALQAVGIENLETCPFCPMAMEYPPVAENKEFHCTNPRCEVVSCRLCRKRTHLPQTCAEAAADEGESARHAIEEAMSDAIIRKCNKCSQPYIKTDGCNKIRCTRCGTLQCYVCKTTVDDYTHFNDSSRGGKEGQCPLFDQNVSLEQRHQNEVKSAEEASRNQIVKDNPNLTEKALKIKVSAQIEKEEKERLEKANIKSAAYRHEARLDGYRPGNAAAAFRRGVGRFVPAAPAQPALAGGAARVSALQYPGPPQVFAQRAVQQPAIQRLAVQQAAVQQAAVQQQGAHQRAVDQYAHYAHALQQRQQAYQQRQQVYQQRQEALQQVAQQQSAQQLRLAQQQLDDLVQQNQRNLLKTQAALMKYQNRPREVPEVPRGNVAPVVASINAPPVAARHHPKPGQNAANPIVLDTTAPERAVRGVISQLSADLLRFKRAMPGADQGSVGPAGNQVERYQLPRPNRYVNVPNHIQGGPNVRAQGAPSPPAAIRRPVAQAQPATAQPDGGSIPRRVRFVT